MQVTPETINSRLCTVSEVSKLCTSGCGRKTIKYGYCAMCLSTMNMQKRVKLCSKVMENGCWEWTGAKRKKNGYGAVTVGNKLVPAHRYSWIAFNGGIAEKLWVLHKCDNKICVNPDHLELGDAKKNTQDAYTRNLIPCGEQYWSAKLTNEQRAEANTLLDAGWRQVDVAERYGVRQSSISLMYAKYKKRTHAVLANGQRVEIAIEGV